VLGSSPSCLFVGGTDFHKPFRGIIRSYIARVGFGFLSVALLPLDDYIVAQTVLFVKHFFYSVKDNHHESHVMLFYDFPNYQ
jgi:hypothetical protein